MKIVLDTNIIVSAFLNPRGLPGEIVSLVLTKKLIVCYDNEPPRSRAPLYLKRYINLNGGSFDRKFIIPSGLIPNLCKRCVI